MRKDAEAPNPSEHAWVRGASALLLRHSKSRGQGKVSSVEEPVEDTRFHHSPKLLVLRYPQFSNKESNSNTASA